MVGISNPLNKRKLFIFCGRRRRRGCDRVGGVPRVCICLTILTWSAFPTHSISESLLLSVEEEEGGGGGGGGGALLIHFPIDLFRFSGGAVGLVIGCHCLFIVVKKSEKRVDRVFPNQDEIRAMHAKQTVKAAAFALFLAAGSNRTESRPFASGSIQSCLHSEKPQLALFKHLEPFLFGGKLFVGPL